MNLKKLFLMLTFFVLLGTTAFAQTVVYVDNTPGVGNDFNSGLTPAQPKATIFGAQVAYPSGTVINVKGTGVLYNETVNLGAVAGTEKEFVFTSNGGTPLIANLTLNLTVVAAPYQNQVTFQGPFQVQNTLTLTAGDILGASYLTIGTASNTGAVVVVDGNVDSRMNFSGRVAYTYNPTAGRSTGNELPAPDNTSNMGNLTITPAFTITLTQNLTMNGVITVTAPGGILDLNTNTLTVQRGGASTVNGDIVNGTLSFNMTTANVTVAHGAGKILPDVVVNDATANGYTFTLTGGAGSIIGSLKVQNNATATVATAYNFDTANGSGNLELQGVGDININAAADIEGNVINSSTFNPGNTSNNSNIIFSNSAHVIRGQVQLTGEVTVSSTTGARSYNKTVEFLAAGVLTEIRGGIYNSCSVVASGNAGHSKNGSVLFEFRTTGNLGVNASGQRVTLNNTSSVTNGYDGIALLNGAIVTGATPVADGDTGLQIFNNISTSGGSGGVILINGDGNITVGGTITNNRTDADGVITFDSEPTDAQNYTITGGIVSSGSSTITFDPNAGTIAVGGVVNVSSGTVVFPTATNASTFTFGGITQTGGTLNLSGTGAITSNITVGGNVSFKGGALNFGTGGRTMTVAGTDNYIGDAATNPTITGGLTIMQFVNPTLAQIQQVTIGGALPVWPGDIDVANGTNLLLPVKFVGGNLVILGNLSFTATAPGNGGVELDGCKLVVGRHLNAPFANGNFTNTAGYSSTNHGMVSMAGTGGQVVTGNGTANYRFGDFEIDHGGGAAVAPANAITITGNLYLTKGTYDNLTGGFNITLGNSTVTPTIIRAEGGLLANPAFTSSYNVQYIGTDKVASFELAGGDVGLVTKRLNNVTVSTTNGTNVPGKGTVELNFTTLGFSVQLNGTLQVDAGQTLLLRNAGSLRLNGTSVVLNGDIANAAATATLRFIRTAGTTVTGAGYLPDMEVAAGSSGNVIDGATAAFTGLLGADNLKGGGDDVDVTTTAATAGLDLLNGTATIAVKFGAGSGLDGSHLADFTTSNGSNTLTLGANLILSGNMNHTKGVVDLVTFNLQSWGAAPSVTGGAGGATFNGTTGTLQFRGPVTVLSLPVGDVTINSNVQVNLANLANVFQLNNATAGNLIVTKDFTLTRGTLQLGNAGTARNLTLRGQNFNITANGSVNAVGIGRVILNPTTPPLTMAFSGSPVIARMTISNNVVLADIDGTAADLTISTSFIHNGGNLDFSDFNLIFQTAFQRTASAGTYSAASGYMIFDDNVAWTVQQGPAFSVPNLAVGNGSGGGDVDFATTAGNGMVTVTGAFDLDIAPNTFNPNGFLTIADGAIASYWSGAVGQAITYTNSAKIYARNLATGTIPTNFWPSTLIPTDFRVNAAAAGVDVYLPGNRSVSALLDLRQGRLDLSTGNTVGRTLTLTGTTVRRRHLAQVRTTNTVASGSLVFNNPPDVIYEPTVGGLVAATAYTAGANFPTGPELPSTVKTLTFTRVGNVANSVVTVITPVTVNELLTIKNDVTTAPIAGTTPVGTITAKDGVTIGLDAGTAPTVPVMIFNTPVTFSGTADQTITTIAGAAFGSFTVNKASGNLLIAGGNLQMRAGAVVNFVNGLIVTGNNAIIFDAPSFAGGGGQGFTRTGVTGTNVSHVVGTAGKFIANTGAINTSTIPRSEFPVGSNTIYRPVSLTFNNNFGVPTTPHVTVLVSHVASNPGGAVALPIKDGVATGIDVARYPAFYWNISTLPTSISPSTVFDLELTAAGFSDFDALSNIRIIRRHGLVSDISNQWLLQGSNSQYDNEVNNGVLSVINRNSTAGLRQGGAVFTLGLKSNMKVKTSIPKQWLVLSAGAKNYSLADLFEGNIGSLTYSAQTSNASVVTTSVSGSTLTVTPVALGDAVVTVVASDAANNDFFAYSFPVNVGLVSVGDEEIIPTEFSLAQNFPNPFNPTTNIKFGLPKESNVTLRIFNILGEEVATLVNKVMPAGFHTVNFDASRLTSGLYIYRIEADNFVQVKKMMLMK